MSSEIKKNIRHKKLYRLLGRALSLSFISWYFCLNEVPERKMSQISLQKIFWKTKIVLFVEFIFYVFREKEEADINFFPILFDHSDWNELLLLSYKPTYLIKYINLWVVSKKHKQASNTPFCLKFLVPTEPTNCLVFAVGTPCNFLWCVISRGI